MSKCYHCETEDSVITIDDIPLCFKCAKYISELKSDKTKIRQNNQKVPNL